MSDWVSREKGQVIPVILPAAHCLIWQCRGPIEDRGYCKAHLGEWQDGRRGNAEGAPGRGVCSVSWCDKPHHAGGWCKQHHDAARKRKYAKCREPGCGTNAWSHGLCKKHRRAREAA